MAKRRFRVHVDATVYVEADSVQQAAGLGLERVRTSTALGSSLDNWVLATEVTARGNEKKGGTCRGFRFDKVVVGEFE